jgi:hypothetical protein
MTTPDTDDDGGEHTDGAGDDTDRRSFLQSAAVLGGASLVPSGGVFDGLAPREGSSDGNAGGGPGETWRRERRQRAAARRQESIRQNLTDRPLAEQPTSGDEQRFGRSVNYFASFSKGLPHDDHGEVDPDAFEALRSALAAENGGDFGSIPQPGVRPLANPEGAVSYNTVGLDPNDVYAPAAPAFDSAEAAAEMTELYWQALARDVPFQEYGDDATVEAAAEELSELTDFAGPSEVDTVFQGTVPGAREGPHVSQFLYKDFERGVRDHDQQLRVLEPGTDYLTGYEE